MSNKLKFTSEYIIITCDRNDQESIAKAFSIPYVHFNRIHTIFKTSIHNALYVLEIFRGITINDLDKLPASVLSIVEAELTRQSITKTLIEHGPVGDHEWLWKHQQLGRELAQVNNKYGFFYDTRTGKTPMGLQIITDDLKANPEHKWLILCPLILIENAWMEDAKKMFPNLDILSLYHKYPYVREKLYKKNASVYVQNIKSFTTKLKELEALNIHGCILDESSALKSPSSAFGKAVVEYASKHKRFYLLSGAPAPNGMHEYYRQLQVLDYYGVQQSYKQYTNYFFNDISNNRNYKKLVIKSEKQYELMNHIKKYSLYVDKEDVLNLPGRSFEEISVEMPADLRVKYEEMKTNLAIELGDNVIVTVPSIAAKLGKLNQISSGFVLDTKATKYNKMLKANEIATGFKDDYYLLSMYKFNALFELLNSFGNKQAIIFANYHKEFDIIKDVLGDECRVVNGQVNSDQKNIAIKMFKQGLIKYLVMHPKSAGKGLTLTNTNLCVYYSLNYSYEDWKQSADRIYGDIVKQPYFCKYYIINAVNSIDKAIYNAIDTKSSVSYSVLNHLKGGI